MIVCAVAFKAAPSGVTKIFTLHPILLAQINTEAQYGRDMYPLSHDCLSEELGFPT
jgi:hypothetical protein